MATKICRWCGKEFEGVGKLSYCPGPHYSTCVVCGSQFEVNPKEPRTTCSKICRDTLRSQTIKSTTKVCELCGRVFHPTNNLSRYCGNKHYVGCVVCGEPILIPKGREYEIPQTCSEKCRKELRKRTCLERYGVDVASKNDAVRESLKSAAISAESKRQATCLSRYGVKNPSMLEEVRNKIRTSVSSDACQVRTRETMISRYGSDFAMRNKTLRKKQSRSLKNRSSLETRLHNMLAEYQIEFEVDHVIEKEGHSHAFDVYLPKYKILVDCDGTFYHSYEDDPDGDRVRDDLDDVRIFLVPNDHMYIVLVESDFERGLRQLQKSISEIDSGALDYDSALFNWCRSVGFPYYNYSEDRLKREWARLCSWDTTKFNIRCQVGISLVNQFHPSIFDCNVQGHVSPRTAWEDDSLLKRVIANRLIYQNDVNPSKVLAGFNISKIAPKVSVFNPMLARYLVNKYLSDCDSIKDPFSGFSGRLLGCASLSKKYEGSDIREVSVKESNNLIQFLGLAGTKVECADVLDLSGTYDAVFTCPPYSNKEQYEKNQLSRSCDDWIDECISRFHAVKYLFVVDRTTKYEDKIVEELKSPSHFRKSSEFVVLIES